MEPIKAGKIGLTLGKYAPFHIGHKRLMDTALSETDKLIVLVYEDSITSIPVHVRANWIRSVYEGENVEVIECYNCPQEVGYTPEIKLMHEQYILKTLGNRTVTHFYSAEPYGEHVSKALNAADRRINREGDVSATRIRGDPYRYKDDVIASAYADMIIKVVFLGAECTGKTTMAETMAEKYKTEFVPEYGAEYWFEHQKNGVLTPEQLAEIAKGHIDCENEAVLLSDKYCFIDTNAMTTYMYALDYHGYALPELIQAAHNCCNRYDVVFLCDDDIPYDDSRGRRGEETRSISQKKIAEDLMERKIQFMRLRGDVETRVKAVERVLSNYVKYEG